MSLTLPDIDYLVLVFQVVHQLRDYIIAFPDVLSNDGVLNFGVVFRTDA